ncbi:hypothetical protein [Chromobacterium paludis]|uniref:Uncharacterized protein n=1 Tax=Chromobacterium paludis TaxID=2605945 RepID=A0A5C1DH08_9NEIS|nr:hypothetical protein [Chromobacterium paludis]QEL55964.1 hypothetical protein FYK34_10550 [Chromobacterium paludis]
MENQSDNPVLDASYVVAEDEAASRGNPRLGRRLGALIILLSLSLSLALGFSLQLPAMLALSAGSLTLFVVMLAATPYLRFVDYGWWTRFDEFGNQLWGDALSLYLRSFWHRRAETAGALGEPGQGASASGGKAAALFSAIYREQYGPDAFMAPLTLLLCVVFFEANYVVLFPLKEMLPGGHPLAAYLAQFGHFELQASAMSGAYMFVVGDAVNRVRKRCLNVADVYWYALRMLLAVPIAYSVTLALPDNVAVAVSFALGALPIDSIIKLLRRLVNSKLELGVTDQPDPLLKLEGVTSSIASELEAEGVASIDELLSMDPVLLSIHTGLPFRFVLWLASQSIACRYLGDAAFSLSAIGLADATSIYCLVQRLRAAEAKGQPDEAAEQILQDACQLLQSVSKAAWPDKQTVAFLFGNIADNAYTGLLMSAGFDRAAAQG